jgi:hypothetical protein
MSGFPSVKVVQTHAREWKAITARRPQTQTRSAGDPDPQSTRHAPTDERSRESNRAGKEIIDHGI